jgi:hypothetical protein
MKTRLLLDTDIGYDPLAAPPCSPTRSAAMRGRVAVQTGEGEDSGLTRWQADPAGGPHEIAVEVNPQAFFREYFSVF